ncbi:ATP-binding protein [Bacillus sp. 31A1R]|uniref:ATP-binding protein n=1 Tax=Robertmurraya mangrovi TaxID=3098077 RepID=A0ABU5J434_9BACI|nr:ATP-binding protein [Bacillus sp. 31A1R]MDZ5474185.1 ATP-binding protein [Bacillus sp. 31A1R]
MMNKEVLKLENNEFVTIANYKEQELEDYKGNPLIEALPDILTVEDAFEQMSYLPPFHPRERNLSSHLRYHALLRLLRFYQPIEKPIQLEAKFSRFIRNGYVNRNPTGKHHVQVLNELHRRLVSKEDLGLPPDIRSTASSFSLIGFPGMGKSSAIERVLSLYPKVIVHQFPINIMQIVWLKLNSPHDGSPKTLCINFFSKIDEMLGTDYQSKFGDRRNSVSSMVIRVGQVARRHCLGTLIIDETQHLLAAKKEVIESMMNFLVTLINEIGIPVMLIGTMKSQELLQRDFRQARRSSGQGDMVWEQMKNDDNWEVLISSMWEYQWIKDPSPLNREWLDCFYEESQGIVDVAVKLFILAQSHAIETGEEKISPSVIKKVSKEHLKMIQPMLEALKNGKSSEISKYEDIKPFDIEDFITNRIPIVNLREKLIAEKEKIAEKRNKRDIPILEKVIINLINLDVSEKLAESTAKRVIKENPNIEARDAVKMSLVLIDEDMENSKRTKNTNKNTTKNTLFLIVNNGRKEKKSAYESLQEAGIISNPYSELL